MANSVPLSTRENSRTGRGRSILACGVCCSAATFSDRATPSNYDGNAAFKWEHWVHRTPARIMKQEDLDVKDAFLLCFLCFSHALRI